jgi:hypothetical protein
MSKILYALRKTEREYYLKDLLNKRECAFFTLEEALKEKDTHDWISFFSLLCEYISILCHLENLLEEIDLVCDWDEKNEQWIMDPKLAMRVSVYLTSERTCHRELLFHNTSFSLH